MKIRIPSLSLLDHVYNRTTLIIISSLAFVGGILYSHIGYIPLIWTLPGVLLVLFLKQRRIVALVLLCLVFFILGTIRGANALEKDTVLSEYYGQKITVDAIITDDGYYDYKKRVVFNANIFEMQKPDFVEMDVPIRVSSYIVSSATRGDVVRVTGKVYPTVGSVAGSIGYAEVETIGTTANSFDKTRRNFVTGLRNALPEPAASLGAGILIGQRSSLTDTWQNIIRDSGLMHIIAVSGYNLTIIVVAVKKLLRKKGSRYQIVLISFLLIAGFMVITGNSPSIMRAAIVVVFLLLSWYYGRTMHPLVLLSLSSAISLLIDPLQIWRSVGWHLSFTAFFGVIVLAPLLVPKTKSRSFVHNILAESFSAGLLTLPIIAAVFGKVSLVGIPSNLLVTPLVPLAMLLSLFAGLAGWFVPSFAGWIALPARFLLTLMLDIANLVSKLPGARVLLSLNAWQLTLFYLVIATLIWNVYKKRNPSNFMLE